MTSTDPSPRTWNYRFQRPDGSELEVGTFPSDSAAEDHARELSTANKIAVKVERQSIVDWDYVTEVDERP